MTQIAIGTILLFATLLILMMLRFPIAPAKVSILLYELAVRNHNSRALVATELDSPHVAIIVNISALRSAILIIAEQLEIVSEPTLNLAIGRQIENKVSLINVRIHDYTLAKALSQPQTVAYISGSRHTWRVL